MRVDIANKAQEHSIGIKVTWRSHSLKNTQVVSRPEQSSIKTRISWMYLLLSSFLSAFSIIHCQNCIENLYWQRADTYERFLYKSRSQIHHPLTRPYFIAVRAILHTVRSTYCITFLFTAEVTWETKAQEHSKESNWVNIWFW